MRTGSDVAIVTIGLFVAVMLLSGCPQWLHADHWCICLVYHFFHANIFHLAVNGLSLWLMLRNRPIASVQLLSAFVIGSLSWFFATADVVGASNIIFALIGLRTPSFRSAWWRQPSVIIFFVITILMSCLPQVSAVTHLVSFVLGCAGAFVSRILNGIGNDIRRASYN